MPTLEDAIALALHAHRGQTDRYAMPYILHPLRLLLKMTDDVARMAAVLHDVVEDTPVTLADLRQAGYPEVVVQAVDALTRRPEEDYMDYVRRAGAHPVARRVKLADLEDNMDVRRMTTVTAADAERLARYRAAWALLQAPAPAAADT
ncbi:MAG: GTP pyrophosphokinase [Anaerolineae bacterium]|jgi:(p)ppGpp synthase/HD superfamily hydrolase|nr:GTP pyrophosphokinase [Anaerolineae bacterium]